MNARSRRLTSPAVLAAMAILVINASTSGSTENADDAEQMHSAVGSYLAGRIAKSENDVAKAAAFYGNALEQDPGNELLLEEAFLMKAMDGAGPETMALAEKLVAADPQNRTARMFLGIKEFKAGAYKKAEQNFKAAASGPIGELTSAMALAWVKLAERDVAGGLAQLELSKQAEWAQFYLRYHKALIADIGGRKADAKLSFDRVFHQDPRALRTTLAYARSAAHSGDTKLARAIIKEHLDKNQGDAHPLLRSLRDDIEAGRKVPLLIVTPSDGLAEALYGLGEALIGEGAVSAGILYLQMALGIEPDHQFALAALANALENSKRYEDAIATYDRIPKGSPLALPIEIRKAYNLNSLDRIDDARKTLDSLLAPSAAGVSPPSTTATAEPDRAAPPPAIDLLLALGSKGDAVRELQEALSKLGFNVGAIDGFYGESTRRAVQAFQKKNKLEADGMAGSATFAAIVGHAPASANAEAKSPAASATSASPSGALTSTDELQVLDALGSILRSRKLYAESVDVYTRILSLIPKVEKKHWAYFYARGTSYERMKNWPAAEADLTKALELAPDQPLVLNYLGYSWIDQGRNLKQGMGLIEKAVNLKPDDGYIVDSLGWAHFKQGNYKEAVRYLERSVELKPDDPILNDHLGDALAKVGRDREARFQWDQALSLNPEPEDAEKIKKKLAEGLTEEPPVRAGSLEKGSSEAKPGTEAVPAPAPPTVQ